MVVITRRLEDGADESRLNTAAAGVIVTQKSADVKFDNGSRIAATAITKNGGTDEHAVGRTAQLGIGSRLVAGTTRFRAARSEFPC